MRRDLLVGYLFIVHFLLLLALLNSDVQTQLKAALGFSKNEQVVFPFPYYKTMLSYHMAMDGTVPMGSVVLIGDSITQAIASNAVSANSVNYGIGGDTTQGVLFRLPHYQSLPRAAAVVLAIGVNDLKTREPSAIAESYRKILKAIPNNRPIICSAVLPINETILASDKVKNSKIKQLNRAIADLCSQYPTALFVDAGQALIDGKGNLASTYHQGDGIHLSTKGNMVWIKALRRTISEVRMNAMAFRNPIVSQPPVRLPPCEPQPIRRR